MIDRWSGIGGGRWRPAAGIGVGALICFVIVMVVPHDVDRVLIPGELMLLAVVTATVAGGRIAGTLVLAGSAVALLYFFVPDPDSFTGGTASDYFSVLLYLLVGAVLIAAVSSLIMARNRLRTEQVRLQLLIDLSTHFDLDLDPDATLREVARAAVSLSDVCVVDVLDRGRVRRAAGTTSDRELDRFVDNLLRHEPQIDNPSHPAVIAIQTGKPVVLDHITADVLDAATDAPEQRRAAGFVQGGSAVVVPIMANREALGAMSLVRLGRPAQPFDSEEVRSRSTSPHEQAKHSSGRAPIRRSATTSSTSSGRSCRNSCPQCPAYPFAVSTGQPKRPRSSVVIGMPWYRSTIPVSPSRLATQPVAGFPCRRRWRGVRYALLALARQDVEPAALLTSLNDYLFAIGQDNFVTVTYGVLDHDRHVWAEFAPDIHQRSFARPMARLDSWPMSIAPVCPWASPVTPAMKPRTTSCPTMQHSCCTRTDCSNAEAKT